MPKEVRDQQLAAIIPYYKSFSREEMNDVVKVDSSLAAMQFMLVARDHGYETNQLVDSKQISWQRHLVWIKTVMFQLLFYQ